MDEDYEVSSYLDMDNVIEAALELGADAIHPGYGFLSENPVFAKKVVEAGLIFIGPSPDSMSLAGDKAEAKRIASEIGVPTLPWIIVKDPNDIIEFGKTHGYPILLKAVGGGGGMGIRIVRNKAEAERLFEQASKEAENAFGDKRLYVEKFLENPKHIEVQILSDGEKVIHLYERDCSIQRRHQKLIEEAPAPTISPEERYRITSDAVKLMEHIGYRNAGTVEMLYDPKTGKHYFMEINARLQVEHPVTEMITGIDIVKEQIHIAMEGYTQLKQEDIRIYGHAIEARVNAENPVSMLPSPGTVLDYLEPNGPGIRVDSGINKGYNVPGEYNPLLAKVIAWAPNRREAIGRLIRALNEFTITGVDTNILLLKHILAHPVFQKGIHTTRFIEEQFNVLKQKMKDDEILHAIAIAVISLKSTNGFRAMIKKGSSLTYVDKNTHRIQTLKRRAWAYWSLLKTRVRRGKRKR